MEQDETLLTSLQRDVLPPSIPSILSNADDEYDDFHTVQDHYISVLKGIVTKIDRMIESTSHLNKWKKLVYTEEEIQKEEKKPKIAEKKKNKNKKSSKKNNKRR